MSCKRLSTLLALVLVAAATVMAQKNTMRRKTCPTYNCKTKTDI